MSSSSDLEVHLRESSDSDKECCYKRTSGRNVSDVDTDWVVMKASAVVLRLLKVLAVRHVNNVPCGAAYTRLHVVILLCFTCGSGVCLPSASLPPSAIRLTVGSGRS